MEMELIKSITNMGIMVVISGLYIKWMPKMVEVVANNTAVIADTREMHDKMNVQIAGIEADITDIKKAIQGEQVKVEEINKAVIRMEQKIERLGK